MSERWSAASPRTCSGDMYADGAQHHAGTACAHWSACMLALGPLAESARFARPKSSTLARPSCVTNTFSGFEVAVDDSLLVRGRQALGDLRGELDRLAGRQGAVREPRAQRLALEQLHDGVGGGALAAEVVDREDVRMGERGDRLCLALEAREGDGVSRRAPRAGS